MDPHGPEKSFWGKVIRGGGWFNEEDKRTGWKFNLDQVHYVCNSGQRLYFPPEYCHDFIGFRICRNADYSFQANNESVSKKLMGTV